MSGLVVITRDLMDGGRFRSAVADVTIVRSLVAPALVEAEVIVLDLGSGIDPATVVAIGPPVVAYGAHVDTEALAAAEAAGCAEVLPRSRIFRRASDLLA